jgi:large subunit ribosomal protein L7/L12
MAGPRNPDVPNSNPERNRNMANITREQVIEYISSMSVLDLAEMVKELEAKFGVSAAAPVAVAAMPGAAAAGAAAPAAEEKTTFTVTLKDGGEKKINVIKEVRAILGLGLKEAKDFVEGAPNTVKEDVTKEEADKIKAQLEAAGAKVEIK